MLPINRVRQRTFAEQEAEEEQWNPLEWEWQPVSMHARKRARDSPKDVLEAGSSAAPGSSARATPHRDCEAPAELGYTPESSMERDEPKLANLPVYNTFKKLDSRPDVCLVEKCSSSLTGLKRYFTRLRICEVHLNSLAIVVDGTISRFCQQCGRFQPLKEFTGRKKSCTERLEKVNARHREKAHHKNLPRRPEPTPQWQDEPPAWNGHQGASVASWAARKSSGLLTAGMAVTSLATASSEVVPPGFDCTSSHGGISRVLTSVPTLPAEALQSLAPSAGGPNPNAGIEASEVLGRRDIAAAGLARRATGDRRGDGDNDANTLPSFIAGDALLRARKDMEGSNDVDGGHDDGMMARPPVRVVSTGGPGVVWYSTRRLSPPKSQPSVEAVATEMATSEAAGKHRDLVRVGSSVSATLERLPPLPPPPLTYDSLHNQLPLVERPDSVHAAGMNMYWNRVTSAVLVSRAQKLGDGVGCGSDTTEVAAAQTTLPRPPLPPPPSDVVMTLAAANSELFLPVPVRMLHEEQPSLQQHQQEARPQTSSRTAPSTTTSCGVSCTGRIPVDESPPLPPQDMVGVATDFNLYGSPLHSTGTAPVPGAAEVPLADASPRESGGFTAGWINSSIWNNNGVGHYGFVQPPPPGAIVLAPVPAPILSRSSQSAALLAAAVPHSPGTSSLGDASWDGGAGAASSGHAAVQRHASLNQVAAAGAVASASATEGFAACVSGVMGGLGPMMERMQQLAKAKVAATADAAVMAAGACDGGGGVGRTTSGRDLSAVVESTREVFQRASELTSWLSQSPQPAAPAMIARSMNPHVQPQVPDQLPQHLPPCVLAAPTMLSSGTASMNITHASQDQVGNGLQYNIMHGAGAPLQLPYRSNMHSAATVAGRQLPPPSTSSHNHVLQKQKQQQSHYDPRQLQAEPHMQQQALTQQQQVQVMQAAVHPMPERALPTEYENGGFPIHIPDHMAALPPHQQLKPQTYADRQLPQKQQPPVVLVAPIHAAATPGVYTRAMSAKSVLIRHPQARTSGLMYNPYRPPYRPYAPLPPGHVWQVGSPYWSSLGCYSYVYRPLHSYESVQPQPEIAGVHTGGDGNYLGTERVAVASSGGEAGSISSAWRDPWSQSTAPATTAAVTSMYEGADDDDDDDDNDGMFDFLLREMASNDSQPVAQEAAAADDDDGGISQRYNQQQQRLHIQQQSDSQALYEQLHREQQHNLAIASAVQQGVAVHRQATTEVPYTFAGAAVAATSWPSPATAYDAAATNITSAPSMEYDRVSIKAMNLQPGELPTNLRSGMSKWLQTAQAEAVQATLRPGCLQLVIDVQRTAAAAASGPLASFLIPANDAEQAAADVFRFMGQRLRDTYVQVNKQVLQIRVGEDPRVTSWEQAAEDGGMYGAKRPSLEGCSTVAICAGSEASLEMYGIHLCQPLMKVFARLRGSDLQAVLSPEGVAEGAEGAGGETAVGADNGGRSGDGRRLRLSVVIPPDSAGLMAVEVGMGHLLGGWWPVLVLPRGCQAAAKELQQLLLQRAHSSCKSTAGPGESDAQQQQQQQEHHPGVDRRLLIDFGQVLNVFAAAKAAADPVTPTHRLNTSGTSSSPDSPSFNGGGGSNAAAATGTTTTTTTATSQAGGWNYSDASDSLASTALGSSRPSSRLSSGRHVAVLPHAASAYNSPTVRAEVAAAYDSSTVRAEAEAAGSMTTVTAAAVEAPAVVAAAPVAAGDAVPGVSDASAAAATASRVRSSTAVSVTTAPPAAAAVVRQALARTRQLLAFFVRRGCPQLTALMLHVADFLAAFAASAHPPLDNAASVANCSATSAARRQQLSSAALDPQDLLPLAVLSGSGATVDVLSGFARRVLGAPLRFDLPQGPAGMSLLHLAAVLHDEGVMAGHLIRTQPWVAWAWMSLGWTPPTASEDTDMLSISPMAASTDDKVELRNQVETSVAAPWPAVQLTPGSLSLLLGQTEPLELALARVVLRDEDLIAIAGEVVVVEEGEEAEGSVAAVEMKRREKMEEERVLRDQGLSRQVEGPGFGREQDAGLAASLTGLVQSWGKLSEALMATLCEQLQEQSL